MMPHGEQETGWEWIWVNQDVKNFVSPAINLCTFYGLGWQMPVKLICRLNFKLFYIP